MRSIADVIRDVIDNTSVEVGAQAAADKLTRELIDALLRAGHPVTEPPDGYNPGGPRLRGIATIHLESSHEPGTRYGVADLTADVNLWLTPVVQEGAPTPNAPIWEVEPDRFVRYDVWMEGFTVPRDGRREHLRLAGVDGG